MRWKTAFPYVLAVVVFILVPIVTVGIWPGDNQWMNRWAVIGPILGLYAGLCLPSLFR
jgi:hypothetical protein